MTEELTVVMVKESCTMPPPAIEPARPDEDGSASSDRDAGSSSSEGHVGDSP